MISAARRPISVRASTKPRMRAKVLVHRILGHKDTLEDHEEQLSNMDDRIAVVQSRSLSLMSAWRRLPRSDRLSIGVVTLPANNVPAMQMLKLAINRSNHLSHLALALRSTKRVFVSRGFQIYISNSPRRRVVCLLRIAQIETVHCRKLSQVRR